MKQILIVSHAMELGGAEKALLGLLESIDTSEYDVDLFLMRHSGELMKYIPDKIHILPEKEQYASLAVPISDVLRKRQIKIAWKRLLARIKAHRQTLLLGLQGDNDVGLMMSHEYTLSCMPMISTKEYDAVISFLTPHYFAAERSNAKKRIAWIHTDYSSLSTDAAAQLKMWSEYDRIVSLSADVTSSFLSVFPSLKDRIVEIGNILPQKYMKSIERSSEALSDMPSDESCRLLSIGRFCNAKNFDNIPQIAALLREKGADFKWYIIGYGTGEELIRRGITENGLEETVIILDKKSNPYPYIRNSDIYVQPSRYEGSCVSVSEAKMLGRPVLISNYKTAASQVEQGIDGIIAGMKNEEIANAIYELLKDESMRERLSENCLKRDYSNSKEINKLYYLINEE